MASEASVDWQSVFQELKRYHDEAFRTIDNALQLEESENNEQAIKQYETGLTIIDKALNIKIECPRNPDDTWEKACSMVQKMKKTRKEVLCRIADTQKSPEPSLSPPSQPPSYDEAMSASRSSGSPVSSPTQLLTYRDLGAALQNLKVETGADSAHILFTHPNVQIYFISHDGTVNAASEPDTLNIVQLTDEGAERLRAYLQVGDWVYPLIPGVSPCLRTEYGAFILPDVHSTEEGAAVGIILPPGTDPSVHELLSDILCGIVKVAAEPEAPPRSPWRRRDLGFSISQGIVRGAQYISHGMVRGAAKAGGMMDVGTPRLMTHLKPEENPAHINPKVQTGLQVAKNVTAGAVTVTGYIASRIGSATVALGRYLAPHIQRQGTRLLSSTCNYSEQEASQKVGSVLQVAAGAVEGFATVYDGLENAAKILGTSLANNTVKVVQHKYGQPAGQATGDTLSTMGNAFVVGHNMRYFTPKGLAKTTAKEAGKAVVEDYRAALHKNGGPSSEVD